jgi:hypothetical protein
MPFLEVMQSYFRGEKTEALGFILPVGLLLAALGVVALKVERGGFAWGVAVPCILAGLVLVGTGTAVGARTSGQVAEITRDYQQEPSAMVQKELPRMEKVNANFRLTFHAFGVLVAAGLAVHYLLGAGWARGLGVGLMLIGAVGLLIDAFAERRAEPYTAALVELARQRPAAPDGGPG